ncbi:MAG TPA: 30S ribosomal protein S17 [archaeon]|nr:30S ribosomal protein S17 [archaeon]
MEKGNNFSVRGALFTGIVKSTKPAKTAVVARELIQKVRKYERYKKTRSKIYAHIPDGISVNEGDRVSVGETRKISKTKSFVVLKVLEREKKKVKSEEK